MGKQTATRPVFTLAELIDRRLAVVKQIESLVVLKEQLAEQIQAEMKGKNLTKALGSSGTGYQLIESLKAEYRPEAVEYAKTAHIAHLFTSDPKITRAKVMDAKKADKITQTQYNALEAFAGPTFTEYTLKTFVEKAKK